MKRFLFCIAACLPVLASASSYVFSGKVTDKSGNGIAGIWVGLSQAKIATLTTSDGSWSLGATSGIADRAVHRAAVTNHLVHEGGHLQIPFDGKDLSGRNLSGITTVSQAAPSSAASRATDATTDTLLYVRGDNILASTVVSSTSFQAGTVALDTTPSRNYTKSGNTLYMTSDFTKSEIYCSGSTLYVQYGTNPMDSCMVRITSEGMELSDFSGEPDDRYQDISKYSRLSGEAGSLVGKFQILGDVYRPLITSVPDSVVKIIAEDSTLYAEIAAQRGFIYEFTHTSFSWTGMNKHSFSREFLNNWNGSDDAWEYSDDDSSWYDYRKYSDSAKSNITVQIVDSSTVKLTGNTTQEVVTITGASSTNGFDQTYVSSNSAHASGTNLAVPTSCPEAVTWYPAFLSANQHTTTAARIVGPRAVAPKHKKLRLF